jgi:hypothetical protein
MSDGCDPGFRCEVLLGLKACAIVTQLGEDLRRVDPSGAREGHQNSAIGHRRDGGLDQARETSPLRDDRSQDRVCCQSEFLGGSPARTHYSKQHCCSHRERAEPREILEEFD